MKINFKSAIILSFISIISFNNDVFSQESRFLEDVLITFENFKIRNSTEKVNFYPNKRFKISVKGSKGSVNGTFNSEFITIEKGQTKHNPYEDMTFTMLNYVLQNGKKEVWVFKEGLVKVENNRVLLPFIRLNDGFDSPTIMLEHIIGPKSNWKSFNWTEIASNSSFLSTIDFTTKAFIGFLIEDSLAKPNEEEALEYALDKLLKFNDEKRKMYGKIVREVIIEKFRNKN